MTMWKKVKWINVLIYVLFASFGFAAALILLWLSGDISLGKDTPALVQAIGSIVAILIAIAVPWWQHRKAVQLRHSEAQVKAVSRAAVAFKGVQELCARIDRAHAALDAKRDVDAEGWSVTFVAIPQKLMDQAGSLHELGEAGSMLLKAINHCFELRDLIDHDQYLYQSNAENFEIRLMAAKRNADAAFSGIKELLD